MHFNIKICNLCNQSKELKQFQKYSVSRTTANGVKIYYYHKNRCNKCEASLANAYRKRTGKNQQYNLKNIFGISLDYYNEMLSRQNNCCAICKQDKSKNYKQRNLSVDHDHKTGKIRGLLCNACNSGIGYFKDNAEFLQGAINYLCTGT